MNILFVATNYPQPGYPFTSFVQTLCREMVRQGNDVTIVSLQHIFASKENRLPTDSIEEFKTEDGLLKMRIYRPYTISSTYGRFGKISKWLNQFIIEITVSKIRKPDICYAHFWHNGYSVLPYAKKNNIPLFIATGEDVISFHRLLTTSQLMNLKKFVKGVICVSTKNMEESVEKGLAERNKCIVIPNAADGEFYPMNKIDCRRILGYPESDFIVSYTGRFSIRKGVDRVGKAIKELDDPHIKSIFIGKNDGGDMPQPECDGILFKGPLPHNKIPTFLCASDVFVLPSLSEGCSNSIVEALACGIPIISSDLPFNYDILNDSNSFLVDPMDIHSIAMCIKDLKEHKELHEEKIQGATQMGSQLNIKNRCNRIMGFVKKQTEEGC